VATKTIAVTGTINPRALRADATAIVTATVKEKRNAPIVIEATVTANALAETAQPRPMEPLTITLPPAAHAATTKLPQTMTKDSRSKALVVVNLLLHPLAPAKTATTTELPDVRVSNPSL
jgi:hypothetical protein